MPEAQKIITCLWFEGDAERAKRTMDALLGMVKLDIAALERAHRGE